MAKTNEIATVQSEVQLSSPQQILGFATQLKDLVVENKLYTKIQGKNYVNVEGWQIAGAFTGIFPIVEKVENLSEDTNYKYRAEVSLYDNEGRKVGSGMAVCSNSEPGKKQFAEYAVASMAQTRAVGKAFRMKIGWLLKVAGYETTPSEEMDVMNGEVLQSDEDVYARDIQRSIESLKKARNIDELRSNFAKLPRSMTLDEQVQQAKDELKAHFGGDYESA